MLADNLAELSFLMKEKNADQSSFDTRTCSFCKDDGDGATRCSSNLYSTTRCPSCGKHGHGEESCWSRAKAPLHSSGPRTKSASVAKDNSSSGRVTYIAEKMKEDMVAAAKRNSEGEALPQQRRTQENAAIPHLLNPPTAAGLGQGASAIPPFLTGQRRTLRKKTGKTTTKKAALQEHVGKYNVIADLANASSRLKFGQVVCGDAEAAKKEIGRLFSRQRNRTRAYAGHVDTRPKRLKLVTVRVYSTTAQALFDSGAVPNLISPLLVSNLCLTPQPSKKRIPVADGGNAPFIGALLQVPTSFGELSVNLDYLVVEGTPFDLIIGPTSLKKLQACIDVRKQHVQITVGEKTMKLGLEIEVEKREQSGSSTDSEGFTSDTDAALDSSSASGSRLFLAVRDEKPFEPYIMELATRPPLQTDAAAADNIALDTNVAELWEQEHESETED